jgi:hypothetical protein
VNVKRERAIFLGEGCRVAVRKCFRSCLRGSTLKERVSRRLSTFLTKAAGRHLCEGWRLVFPQISPYQLCYFFHIL